MIALGQYDGGKFKLNFNFNNIIHMIKTPLQVLEITSRTFYIPIARLPALVKEAVASAYLCLRAIDQIEDHPHLSNNLKQNILKSLSLSLQKFSPLSTTTSLCFDWHGQQENLPQVSKRLAEWIFLCPPAIRARVVDCTATMADRMAYWAQKNWKIENEGDLDCYTFAVAGAVGLILCQIWEWFQGTKTDRSLAIGYGRALQSVNILRNSSEDLERGVTFYPSGWSKDDMMNYSKKNLEFAKEYIATLPIGSAALAFCEIPYALAQATLNIMQQGLGKLTREQVGKICKLKC